MQIQPYLFFNGRCEEAINFYREAHIMASDGMAAGETNFKGFSLSIDAPDAARVDRLFMALAKGGSVTMPAGKTFWSPWFGMVTDRFGVGWMVGVNAV